jgi:BirA family biotin operon repressor/biotin-[acetyl-CoA-carboxylase] ligase
VADLWLGTRALARGYRLRSYESVGSTSSEAAAAVQGGDSGPLWFAALHQSEGRGRRGRQWQSPHGNLAASLLLTPDVDAGVLPTLGFVAGLALYRALNTVVGHGLQTPAIALKWPNDVLANGAKLSGILLEAHSRKDGRSAVVIGIGVNVVATPEGLPYPAAALANLGSNATAAEVFAALAESWVDAYELWDSGRGIAGVLEAWRNAAAGIGSEITVSRDGDVLRGIFESIDDTGRLIVRANDNSRVAISAGDVHLGQAGSARL